MDNTINSKSVNEQLSFIMHEIHTSLNSITKTLHFLSRKDLSRRDEQEIVKAGILEACQYADTMRMFLDYWQLSANPADYFAGAKMRLEDLYRDFNNPNEYFKSVMKKKHLDYRLQKIDDRIPYVEAYPIVHAISNIMLDNAIKYAPADTQINCFFEVDGNDLVIRMENDGPYLTPNETGRIFEKGTRGVNAQKANVRGHGFGMVFLKQIVEAHDGTVEVQSENNYPYNGIPH
ncbi:MAG: sensor histidine kinase, partial [Prevotellaceae bacterium]|nr:sensor histidine kinase [Prevotellaceae bacterium]